MARGTVARHTDDAGTGGLDQPVELVELEQRDAELGVHARGAHVVVVTAAEIRVDAHQHVAAAEQLRPCTQRVDVVERHVHAVREAPLVFRPGREVGREQDAIERYLGKHAPHVLHLAR